MGRCCAHLSNTLIVVASTIYLLLGLITIGVAASTFFTAYGQILTPVYAGSFTGGGASLFIIAVIGFTVANNKKIQGTRVQGGLRPLWIFTFLTFFMMVFTVVTLCIMFNYEQVLGIAAQANVVGSTTTAVEAIGTHGTTFVKTLSVNMCSACSPSVNTTSANYDYTFACSNREFMRLGGIINNTCLIDPPIITDSGDFAKWGSFYTCYGGDMMNELVWVKPTPLPENVASVTEDDMLAALRTPKGVFCACSSQILTEFILPYFAWVKYIMTAICVFFFFVFVSCIHQLCTRGCCTSPRAREGSVEMRYHQQGGGASNGKKNQQRNRDEFLARP
jgi:hypothetical protein